MEVKTWLGDSKLYPILTEKGTYHDHENHIKWSYLIRRQISSAVLQGVTINSIIISRDAKMIGNLDKRHNLIS
jgi:hypothetical protein